MSVLTNFEKNQLSFDDLHQLIIILFFLNQNYKQIIDFFLNIKKIMVIHKVRKRCTQILSLVIHGVGFKKQFAKKITLA